MAEKNDPTAALLAARKEAILEAWLTALSSGEAVRTDLMSRGELAAQSREFLDAFEQAARLGGVDDPFHPALKPLRGLLESMSYAWTRLGFSPAETAMYVFSLKDALLRFLQEEYGDRPETLNREVVKVSRLLDGLGLITFEAYVKGREEIINRQQQELLELSTPVIKVWDGVLALPLIGSLDSARTQVVMESLLQRIVDIGATVAILDISGVPAVDTLVAQHLLKTVSAARLMGAECVISGIRPEIAQTMVSLGVDLSGVKTKAAMADALQEALKMTGQRVVRAGDGASGR